MRCRLNPQSQARARNTHRILDYDREIAGSIDYIERELLPEGKKVEVLLWSGNCRPGPGSARRGAPQRDRQPQRRRHGDLQATPGEWGVAPRTTYWGSELQVYAPNQNDYVYTNDWEGPIYSGFAQAIDTFELTESPRRLQAGERLLPFLQWRDAEFDLGTSTQVYRWCASQPLHSITAGTYAKIAKDSHLTKIYKISAGHWRIVGDRYLRTFRIPVALGFPDMVRPGRRHRVQ